MLLALEIFFGVVTAVIARQKGRNEIVWFVTGFFLSLLGPVIAFLYPPAAREGITKKCPRCAEIIRAEALGCRYCGAGLQPAALESEVT